MCSSLSLFLPVVGGIPNGTYNTSNGTDAPYTGATVGPGWHAGSGTLSIRNMNNVQNESIITDSTGHSTISLPTATYLIQPVGDSALKEHTIMITSGGITRDTINFCPDCV
jgi:hypothetical protein